MSDSSEFIDTHTPEFIGPYRIEKKLGEGGFSIVYLVMPKDANKAQYMALKVLNPAKTTNLNMVTRFRQEAKAIVKLKPHPHIINIFETDKGTKPPFIAMEYIGGGSLRDRLKNESYLSRSEAIHIFRCIGSALAYTHDQGIIHRDIKPENILLDTAQGWVRPVLTDFGLFKSLVEESGYPHTPTAAIMGTYHYMAPEQWHQKSRVTPATDVYALAITFFETLSGRRPFESDSPFELMDMHRSAPPPCLSNMISEVGPFFDNVLIKGMAKKLADRYQNVTDFINAIEVANKQAEKYEILGKIGDGGFATIYKARYLSSNKLVALKVLKLRDDLEQVKRFKQEARVVAKLEHPNIIKIIDIPETSQVDSLAYIVMEYIAGGTLRNKLEAGPLYRDEAVHIVKSVGAALTVAHERQIIHRDLKPENILLDASQEILRPVLTDFGSVKVLAIDSAYSQIETAVDSLIGSRFYMAPEQLERDGEPTPAIDIYALALIFFEMLTGQHPFESGSLRTGPVPALSSLAPKVGPFFDTALIKALDEKPANRYQTVIDFIQAIVAANEQAEQALLKENQKEAGRRVELTRDYVSEGNYNPKTALDMIREALDLVPTHIEALRWQGKIYVKQRQIFEALKPYEQAYRQVPDPFSELGQEYLQTLMEAAKIARKDPICSEIEYYQTIWQIVGESDNSDGFIQEIQKQAQARLIEYYRLLADEAYNEGQPGNLAGAISTITASLAELKRVKATETIIADFSEKQNQLQVTYYENIVQTEETFTEKANIQDISHSGDETILENYTRLNEAYHNLFELTRDQQWQEKQRKKLREQADYHQIFGRRAEEKHEPDYKTALRHCKAVCQIEKDYPNLSVELEANLDEKITELEEKAANDSKYYDIRHLMARGKIEEALWQLNQHFICQGNYEHRDVAKMLWELVYAKRHNGELPLGWDGVSGLEVLSERLGPAERTRIDLIRIALQPWSNLLEVIMQEQHLSLSTYEDQINQLKVHLNKLETLEQIPEIDKYYQELAELEKDIQNWRAQLQGVDNDIIPQKIKGWLQDIDDIEAHLQETYSAEEAPKFFSRSDQTLELIEEDPVFAKLQTLASTALKVRLSLYGTQVKIQEQLGVLQQKEVTDLRRVKVFIIGACLVFTLIAGVLWELLVS